MSWDTNLPKLLARHADLQNRLASPDLPSSEFGKVSKEYSDLTPLAEAAAHYLKLRDEFHEAEKMMRDSKLDSELRRMAEDEFHTLKDTLPEIETNLKIMLLPKDSTDEKGVILEVRAGTGGEEAALFAANLFRMYQRFAELNRWTFEVMNITETGIGGLKEATASIEGMGIYGRLKFESGVHRVQRVPETEASGRVHTSAATVAVMPEAEEVDIKLEDKDLRIDVYRASGAGGQHVNTTDSAVRITHIPTGVVVTQQDERSQHKNKAKAMKILMARLFESQREKLANERSSMRKNLVGSGDRSERIRTYNFPQGRVTDHRINLTLYQIESVMNGEALNEFIDALITQHQTELLAELEHGT